MKLKDLFNKNTSVKKQYRFANNGSIIDASLLPEKIDNFDNMVSFCSIDYQPAYYGNGKFIIAGVLRFLFKENNLQYNIVNYDGHPEILFYELRNDHSKRIITAYNNLSDEDKLRLELEWN